MESIAKRGQFEDFRLRCKELIQGSKQLDHFSRPNATADMMPQEGITYLLGKCSLMDDWNGIKELRLGAQEILKEKNDGKDRTIRLGAIWKA